MKHKVSFIYLLAALASILIYHFDNPVTQIVRNLSSLAILLFLFYHLAIFLYLRYLTRKRS
ncbi:hypothetical protein [Streptococcus loxodontisalivarius]|uniref:Uncharacterized protein n=1 Tax=Streptococcus loxodontisalivarius TaxID=1349415 RepID=A0ABS2PUG5_9STRE|nr:hypothetical protein [Streptococcus loxodontisalivarius]MBM7643521.1 hypothetical protein [Streptococcus loxodontisalivarius]